MKSERSSAKALAAIFSGHGYPFRLEEFPIPRPGPGEYLIDISCSTICGSDLHTWHGRRQEPVPCILGHEIVGRIVAFGPRAPKTDLRGEPLEAGDRITWTLAASCGQCYFCRHGLPQKCEHLFKYGHSAISPGREFSGGFAECCLLNAGTGIVKLPDDLPDAIAAPANCAVATVAAAHRLSESMPGDTVVIIGSGVLGLTACAMAQSRGAAEIIACDLDPTRKAAAMRFGATHFCTPDDLNSLTHDLTRGRGADLGMEFSGSTAAVTNTLNCVRIGGSILIAGTTTPGGTVALDPNLLVRRMLTIRGLHNYAPEDLVQAVHFLAETHEQFPYEQLAGEGFPLEQIETAFAHSSRHPGSRVAVLP